MQKRSEKPKTLGWIFISIFLHVGACLVYFALSLARPPFLDDRKVISVNIVQKGKARDEKLLPRLVSEAPPSEIDASRKPAPIQKESKHAPALDKHAVAKEKTKPVAKTDPARRNVLDALQKRLKSFEKEGKEEGAENGNSLTGDLANAYEARVQAMLYESFLIPALISKSEARNLMVKVKIRIGSNGEPAYVGVVNPSKNSDFDSAVIANAKSIVSFGPPPLPLRKKLQRDGLEIEMCPYKCPKKE